jgi:eukaryotic-like serine/threonine-protein kinase
MERAVHFTQHKDATRISSLGAAQQFLRRQLWIWPIIAAVLLALIGWWVNRSVEAAMQDSLKEDLTTLLAADVVGLKIWFHEQIVNATALAHFPAVIQAVQKVVTLADKPGTSPEDLLKNPALAELRAAVEPAMKLYSYQDFIIVTPTGRVAASRQDHLIGDVVPAQGQTIFARVLHGDPMITRPFRSMFALKDDKGQLQSAVPTILVAVPVRDAANKIIGLLGCRIPPEGKFTEMLQSARRGETGETYAFDEKGLILSNSRFDDQLKRIGLLADLPDSHSILTLELRNPEVNMAEGDRPSLRRSEQPLTKLAASATKGETGFDVIGYRDYRGVPTIGAWTWLPEYQMGIGTEVDYAEAYRPLQVLRRTFGGLFFLLVLSAIGMYGFLVVVARQQRQVDEARKAAQQLGQYTLEDKIGEGGMGSVYKARHAMLQRPTAVKLLDRIKAGSEGVLRFEREVQLTSQLCHPNTIAIYDFGSTPDGVFYYAMEFLEGITLEDLVVEAGPLPEGRAIAILLQVCGSLAEAHARGLIHRDIKPANIMVTYRAGIPDFVKVLDFGLARAVRPDVKLTESRVAVGTPQYMAPETIENPESADHRADIYAVGAVAYYLITGQPVFTGDSTMAVCMAHIQTAPTPPSMRSGRLIDKDLEAVLLWCLSKKPTDRPGSVMELSEELAKCPSASRWTAANGRDWWEAKQKGNAPQAISVKFKGDGETVTQVKPETGKEAP